MKRDPRETERVLLQVAGGQGGYFTAAQARSVGYAYRQQNYHRQRGNWLHIDHGVYRLRDYPDSEREDLIRWSFWSRNRRGRFQAVVSHETALALHELGDVMPGKVHLTVPPRFRKKAPGGCVLHTARLNQQEIEHHRGFNVTTPYRTLLDAADSPLSQDLLESAVRDALRRGMVRSAQIRSAEGLSKGGRVRLKEAIEAAERVEVG